VLRHRAVNALHRRVPLCRRRRRRHGRRGRAGRVEMTEWRRAEWVDRAGEAALRRVSESSRGGWGKVGVGGGY
jgi:hypothetical protein